MTEDLPSPPTGWALEQLPLEITELILGSCLQTNPVAVLQLNRSCLDLLLPKLYARVSLDSLHGLRLFVHRPRAAVRLSETFTKELRIEIPGVPGSDNPESSSESSVSKNFWKTIFDEDESSALGISKIPRTESGQRLILVSLAIRACPHIRKLELAFFSISHPLRIARAYVWRERELFVMAIACLDSIESLSWTPPGLQGKVVGISIAVVDGMTSAIEEGLELAVLARRLEALCPDRLAQLPPFTRVLGSLAKVASSWSPQAKQKILAESGHPLEQVRLENVHIAASTHHRSELEFHVQQDLRKLLSHSWLDDGPKEEAIRAWLVRSPHSYEHALPRMHHLSLTSAVKMDLSCLRLLMFSQHSHQRKKIRLTDAFTDSIWGPRVTERYLRQRADIILADGVNDVFALTNLPDEAWEITSRLVVWWLLAKQVGTLYPWLTMEAQIYFPLTVVLRGNLRSSLLTKSSRLRNLAQEWLDHFDAKGQGHSWHHLDFSDEVSAAASCETLLTWAEAHRNPVPSSTFDSLIRRDLWLEHVQADAKYSGRGDLLKNWLQERLDAEVQRILTDRFEWDFGRLQNAIAGGQTRVEVDD